MNGFKYITIIICFCAGTVSAQYNLSDLRGLFRQANRFDGYQVIDLSENEWKFSEKGQNSWKTARVPGCVHTDISTPDELYYGDNEAQYRWIEEKDWEYVTNITLTPEMRKSKYTKFGLWFDELDGYTEIYINDERLLHPSVTSSAFQSWYVSLNALKLQSLDSIRLKLVFISPVKKARALAKEYLGPLPGGDRVYARKAQYAYGWDFAPRFVTSGIRKPVYFIAAEETRTGLVGDIKITEVKTDSVAAQMNAFFQYESSKAQDLYVCLPDLSPMQYIKVKMKKGINQVSFPFKITHPQLWWPRGYGESVFYPLRFTVQTKTPAKKNAKVLLDKTVPYAFCTIDLVREKDAYGRSFYFRVNGKPVFAKGVNMVPYDMFVENWNDMQLNQLYYLNVNMVRVWGGGYYPSDEFYWYCLANGIMVWQDLMFANSPYPVNPQFLDHIRTEIREQSVRIKKFGNVALWCGNNEITEGWLNWGWQKEMGYGTDTAQAIWQWNEKLFNSLEVEINGNNGRSLNYILTSPQHGWGTHASMHEGDSHYWGVWWGKQPIDTFNYRIPRFMSEYGMQSMPSAHYLLRYAPLSGSDMDRQALASHQKHPSGFGTLDFYLEKYYHVPQNIFQYVYASQLLQAYTLRTAIEAQRRHREKCMGSLVWQMNDCWPGITWSLVDHGLHPKIAYEQVRSSFETFAVSVEKNSGGLAVYIVSDSLVTVHDSLSFAIYDQNGHVLQSWSRKVHIEPGTSKVYLEVPAAETAAYFPSSIYAVAQLHKMHKIFHHDFVLPNQKLLEDPGLKAEIVPIHNPCDVNCLYEFRLTAQKYCPDLAYFPREEDRPLIYRSFIDPAHPLVIPFRQNDYGYYRSLTVKPAEKFMYLYRLMKAK